jgi:hypothetical protein
MGENEDYARQVKIVVRPWWSFAVKVVVWRSKDQETPSAKSHLCQAILAVPESDRTERKPINAANCLNSGSRKTVDVICFLHCNQSGPTYNVQGGILHRSFLPNPRH